MKPFVLIAASIAVLAPIQAQAQSKTIKFAMTVSTGASTCLPAAAGTVFVHSMLNGMLDNRPNRKKNS